MIGQGTADVSDGGEQRIELKDPSSGDVTGVVAFTVTAGTGGSGHSAGGGAGFGMGTVPDEGNAIAGGATSPTPPAPVDPVLFSAKTG